MDTPNGEYQVTAQVHVNNLNTDGTVTPGYQITVLDNLSGVTFPVFVPDTKYNAENVRTLVNYQLEHIRAVHALTG